MIARYSRPEMVAIWTDEAKFQLWLEIEILALEGLVEAGLAPKKALEETKQKAKFSVARILEIENEVKHDVIAFLTNVAEYVGESARLLHYGMTSSDLLDTAFAVQLNRASELILKQLDLLLACLKRQAEEHKYTVCVGRSHGIHAEPTTFGLKLAGFYAELKRQRQRLVAAKEDVAVGAISGAVGTFANIPPSVEAFVCKKLGLKPDAVSTQIIQRDRHAALFSVYAQIGASIERLAVEIRHLQRTEVREAEEAFEKGQKGSSAMPHKRNPILSENISGLARLLRGWAIAAQENVPLWHERDISHSSVERVVAPDATVTLDFMLARATRLIEGLQVYPEKMKQNLDLTCGLVFSGTLLLALTEKGISREQAYAIVQKRALETWDGVEAETGGASFYDRVSQDKSIQQWLSKEEIERVFSIEPHLKHVDFIFDRVFS